MKQRLCKAMYLKLHSPYLVKTRGPIRKVSAIDHALVASDLPKFGPVISEFHQRVQNGEPRLALLQEFAERKVYRWTAYATVRPMRTGSIGMRKGVSPCWVCAGHGYVRHHIIQVMHGGRNRRTNLVRLCQACHALVHPHMLESEGRS